LDSKISGNKRRGLIEDSIMRDGYYEWTKTLLLVNIVIAFVRGSCTSCPGHHAQYTLF